ncbi:MAG: hypothetical protein WBH49_04575 [Flavobacteriaceae bacterium]
MTDAIYMRVFDTIKAEKVTIGCKRSKNPGRSWLDCYCLFRADSRRPSAHSGNEACDQEGNRGTNN